MSASARFPQIWTCVMQDAEQERKRRQRKRIHRHRMDRSLALVVLFFIVTIVRLGGHVADRPI